MKKLLFISFALLLVQFVSAQTTRYYTVVLRSNAGTHTLWDGTIVDIYGFAPSLSQWPTLPGKILYANEGDTVVINAWSISQGEHHTIHLHGLDVDTRNDGDPSTSFWLSHMQDTTYTFIATHPGTYIYHCHVGDVVHVQMGMYGLIVVNAAGGAKTAWTGGPAYDKDYKWLTSELDKEWHDNPPVHDTITDEINLPPYIPEYFLINGKSKQQIAADDSIRISGAQGEVIYLRLANIGFFDNKVVFPAALNAQVISTDGRPLPSPIVSDTVWMSPGERFGVLLQPNTQFIDSIAMHYVNMNTQQIWETEYVPVNISGYFGIEESHSGIGIDIYPNPANGSAEVTFERSDLSRMLVMFNSLGQKVKTQIIASGTSKIHIAVDDLPAGVYYIGFDRTGGAYRKLIISR